MQNNEFITTEVFQQLFKGVQPYFNEVESTTAYQLLANLAMEANQVTAVYLSPQDPDYFKILITLKPILSLWLCIATV